MTQTSAPTGYNPFRAVLRAALVPTLVAGVVTAVVLGLVQLGNDRGLVALVSGLIGAAIAVAFFGSAMLLVSRVVRDTTNPMLFMAVGMTVYFAQVIALLFVLIIARRTEALDSVSAGIAMLVCVVVWQVAQVLAWRRARVPIYDEDAVTPAPATDREDAR